MLKRLVWGLLAPCLNQPPPFCAHPTPCCLLPCSFTVSLCCFVFFLCDPFSPTLPQASSLLSACLVVQLPLEKEKLETDTCWVEQSCSITGLMHHKGPQRTPRTYSSLSGTQTLLFLTNKNGRDWKMQREKLETVLLCNAFLWRSFEL